MEKERNILQVNSEKTLKGPAHRALPTFPPLSLIASLPFFPIVSSLGPLKLRARQQGTCGDKLKLLETIAPHIHAKQIVDDVITHFLKRARRPHGKR